jgi:hypothetical protein
MTSAPSEPSPTARFPFLALAAALLTAVGVGMILIAAGRPGSPPSPPASEMRTGVVAPAPAAIEATPHNPAHPDAVIKTVPPIGRAEPMTLDIPSIKVHSSVMSLGLQANGAVEVPPLDKNAPVGWYRNLAAPGEAGPAVILGHVDSARDGPSVFFRLGQVRRGDVVRVTRSDGAVATFGVQSVAEVPKSVFPTDAVYGPTNQAELRLVTCGGAFDRSRGSYVDNIIVFATLQSVEPRAA